VKSLRSLSWTLSRIGVGIKVGMKVRRHARRAHFLQLDEPASSHSEFNTTPHHELPATDIHSRIASYLLPLWYEPCKTEALASIYFTVDFAHLNGNEGQILG
jgi:hypothetical protein